MPWKFDCLIVGAGFAGLTAAERLCTQLGKRCLVVEKRDHIGGNAYDQYDDHGVLIHTYGPHYFRTNSPRIREYLSQFTEWHPVDYTILSHTGGTYWKFPIKRPSPSSFIPEQDAPNAPEPGAKAAPRYTKCCRLPIPFAN